MFDNHSAPPNTSAPNNLPVGEPDDMFANAGIQNDFAADPIPGPVPSNDPARIVAEPPVSLPTALDAGVLKPRNQALSGPPEPADLFTARPERVAPVMNTAPASLPLVESSTPPRVPENVLRAPMGGRTVWITVATLLSLGVISAAGAWVYFAYINPEPEVVVPVETEPSETTPPPTVTEPTEEVTSVTSTDSEILFGETILDTDSDGLDDLYEKKNGTNMLEWDTDTDGLSDGDEVMTWKTDPLKIDTDNDTYSDTTEIRNGYNPRGDGKLFPVTPTSTPDTTVTPSST